MSTRSGKRIHSSLHENTEKAEPDVLHKSERKTRNRRFKENEHGLDVTLHKSKKRQNYVSYPIETEPANDTGNKDATEIKSTRKIKRYTLKEHNTNVTEINNLQSNIEAKKATRVTRQMKKCPENIEEVPVSTENGILLEESATTLKKGKKNKKKKSKDHSNTEDANEFDIKKVSKKAKKNKGKQSKSSQEPEVLGALNATNTSTDSFHSATSSPQTDQKVVRNLIDTAFKNISENEKSLQKDSPVRTSNKKKKYIIKIREKNQVDKLPLEKSLDEVDEGKDSKKMLKSSITITEHDDSCVISKQLNSTFDKIQSDEVSAKINTTFEKEPKAKRSLRSSHVIAEINDTTKVSKTSVDKPLNNTFEKISEKGSPLLSSNIIVNMDSTFDKFDPKLDSTFDKTEPKADSGKSSLITSDDGTVNLTYDKENSSISITSDESKTEHIVNTTPVLIESSMDESHLSTLNLNMTKERDISPTPAPKDSQLQVPITLLKREGTFTKEGPEINVTDRTPTKANGLPSPGSTPFHTTRKSQKSVLNVTRSIEKSRRSSLAEVVSRQTKVMFCSPVNNPLLETQQKRKIIKSSMKGSNKSFVFEEKEPTTRPAARKRSYTHDADDRSTKRKRLADDLLLSVDRLSRPRTSSASAKLAVTYTPSKKAPTPSKPKSDIKRTKLPNFAALHQKEFDKMESLNECVTRKAKRARQLLTPTGAITVLERSSPNTTTLATPMEPVKETKPKEIKNPEKPETPVKLTKLPTLESLRPGYTRFGFKMNSDVNPFNIASKKDCKTTEKKPKKPEKSNGLNKSATCAPKTPMLPTASKLTTQPMLPSLTGTTTTRKEAAKQTVLREKSFSSLSGKRDMKRNECRTIIKGVRTNRRFELQMKMRNVD